MKTFGTPIAVAAACVFLTVPALADGVQKPVSPAHFPAALASSELSELSGGASPTTLATTEQNLLAVSSGNSVSANSIVSGDVAISPGAFSGFSGIGNFVFNTGNNNNLQGSLSITIITPPAN